MRRRRVTGDDFWDWDPYDSEFLGGHVSQMDTDPQVKGKRRPRRIGFRMHRRVLANCVEVTRREVKPG